METIKKLLDFLAPIPRWARIVFLMICAAVASFCLTSCGVTRAVVHNGATGTSTEIKITTSNPTTVTATPNIQVNPPLQNDMWLVWVIITMSAGHTIKRRLCVEAKNESIARIEALRFMDVYTSVSQRYKSYKLGNVFHYLDRISFKD